MLGAGFLCYMAGNVVPVREGTNNLQNWPHIIAMLGGALVMAVGVLVTGFAPVRSRGPLRVAGMLLLAGLLLLPFAAVLSNMAIEGQSIPIGGALEVLGFAGVCLGVAGIGALAMTGESILRGGWRLTGPGARQTVLHTGEAPSSGCPRCSFAHVHRAIGGALVELLARVRDPVEVDRPERR